MTNYQQISTKEETTADPVPPEETRQEPKEDLGTVPRGILAFLATSVDLGILYVVWSDPVLSTTSSGFIFVLVISLLFIPMLAFHLCVNFLFFYRHLKLTRALALPCSILFLAVCTLPIIAIANGYTLYLIPIGLILIFIGAWFEYKRKKQAAPSDITHELA